MKRFLASTATVAVLVGAIATASAKAQDFSVYFSVGQGALYDSYNGGFFNAGPFNLEVMGAKEIMQGVEVNVGFMFGVDVQDSAVRGDGSVAPTPGATPMAKAKYLGFRSEEHTSELQSQSNLVCRLLLEKKK